MEGVALDVEEVSGWADVVCQTADGGRVSSHVVFLPLSKQIDEEVSSELSVEHLREEVEIGHKGGLEDNRDVGGVEELNSVRSLVATNASGGESQFNAESL